ncbi:MAG: NADH-quinone oxidoreductase subunit C [Cytophagales bacterium]|nr:NADH-quinone oxidoreductase subunit C [Cytophagales bacterium]
MPIASDIILTKLNSQFGDGIVSHEEQYNMLIITAKSHINVEILKYLYHEDELKFQFLTDLTGVHYPESLLPFCVVYHLHSLTTNTRLRLKFFVPLENPEIETMTSLYASANWMERETYDFFGIIFKNHPNLRRILNVDDMQVHPMRKEYPLEDPNRVDKKDHFFGR